MTLYFYFAFSKQNNAGDLHKEQCSKCDYYLLFVQPLAKSILLYTIPEKMESGMTLIESLNATF